MSLSVCLFQPHVIVRLSISASCHCPSVYFSLMSLSVCLFQPHVIVRLSILASCHCPSVYFSLVSLSVCLFQPRVIVRLSISASCHCPSVCFSLMSLSVCLFQPRVTVRLSSGWRTPSPESATGISGKVGTMNRLRPSVKTCRDIWPPWMDCPILLTSYDRRSEWRTSKCGSTRTVRLWCIILRKTTRDNPVSDLVELSNIMVKIRRITLPTAKDDTPLYVNIFMKKVKLLFQLLKLY